MKRLIVNADDFGLTAGVSKGIVDAYREGIVRSTTLMANGAAFDSAESIIRRTPGIGIGVHLNLTTGKPVSPVRSVSSLVGRDGRFHLSPGRLLRSLAAWRLNLAEVETELRGQITKVLRAGIRPTHLDGHKHVHVMPGLSQIVIRLAQEFSIQSVRCPREFAPNLTTLLRNENSSTAMLKQYLVGRAVAGFASSFAERLAKAGLLYAEHFYGLSQTGFLDTRGVLEILERLPEGVSELMCHPGYLDGDLVDSGTRLLAQREIEIRALTAPAVNKLVADSGIQLVSYEQVAIYAQKPVPRLESVSIGAPPYRCGGPEQGDLSDE